MKRMIHYAFVLFVIAALSSGMLAVVNGMTIEKIAAMDKSIEMEARKNVLPQAVRFEEKNSKEEMGLKYIPGYDAGDKITGYVVSVDTPAYGPSIKFVVGIGIDGKVTGLKVTDASKETPGLGDKVNGSAWQASWVGRDVNYEFKKETDGFAGATISPRGVYIGLKKALQGFENIKEGI